MIRFLFVMSLVCCTGVLGAQEIAITFDDAPTGDGPLFSGVERSNRILKHLRTHGVREAAFFVITSQIDSANNARLLNYARAGHLLANHTHRHRRIHVSGPAGYIRDMAIADSILRTYPRFVNWFRFPFLDEGRTVPTRDSLRAALETLGLTNGYVTVDNYDWYLNHLARAATAAGRKVDMVRLRTVYIDHIYNSLRFYDSIAENILGRSPRHVLLLHENDLAASFLGDLLSHLKQQGWKIISPRLAYEDPISRSVPDVLFNNQGRVAALAHERGVARRDLVQEAEDEKYLEELVVRRRIFD